MEFSRITVNPAVCLGQPTVRGTRLTASTIIKLLGVGKTIEEMQRLYPELEADDVRQVADYAAWMLSEQNVSLPS
jgi:uncharacterized protein (DUF433 family)